MRRVPPAGSSWVRLALAVTVVAVLGVATAQEPVHTYTFTADLSGANVVPPVDTTATGWAVAILSGRLLQVDGAFSGLSSDLAVALRGGVHIHHAVADDIGPILFQLDHDGVRSGTFSGVFSLDDLQIQQLRDGEFYVQVHSVDHGAGELRGQLLEHNP